MILTLSNCKECFSRFVAKLRCWQVFFAPKKVSACLQVITLILAGSHSNESFSLFK